MSQVNKNTKTEEDWIHLKQQKQTNKQKPVKSYMKPVNAVTKSSTKVSG